VFRNVFGGNAVWQLVQQADLVSKGVLLILLIVSIISWTVFLYKLILFRIKKKQMKVVLKAIKAVTSFEELLALVLKHKGTLPGYFLSKNLSYLKTVLLQGPIANKFSINGVEWEIFQQNIDQTIEDIIHNEQEYLTVLSTSVAISPLLGLFGTIWGLVHSFVRISEKGAADITTVAPGIAEALITTLAGLAVAIPTLVMFSYCNAQVRYLDHQISLLADQLISKVQKFVLKQ